MNSKETLQSILGSIMIDAQTIRIQQVQATIMWPQHLQKQGHEAWNNIYKLHKEASELIEELSETD